MPAKKPKKTTKKPKKTVKPDTFKGTGVAYPRGSEEVRATADLFGGDFDEGDAAATQDLFDDLGY